MSLINDALKKAQKQRTGEMPTLHSMPSVGGESPQRISRRSKPAGFNTLMVRAGIAGGAALVIAVGAYFALRQKPETGNRKPEGKPSDVGSPLVGGPQASAPAQPSAISNQPSAAGPAKPESSQVSGSRPQVSEQPPAASAPVTFTLKTEPAGMKPETGNRKPESQSVASSATPQPSAISPQPPVSAQPSSSAAGPAKPESSQVSGFRSQVSVSAPAPKLEPRAIEFIENLKVAGIRASATDPKVLMNDRVYRPGSTVSGEMGLKLVEITAGSLTFEDEKGGRYTRTF